MNESQKLDETCCTREDNCTVAIEQFSVFEYLYRDASNYKAWGEVLLSGAPNERQLTELVASFESKEFFIAENVGIPSLQHELWEYSNGPTSDDHVWHSFHKIRAATNTDVSSMKCWGTVDDFISKVKAVSDWKIPCE